MLHARRLVGVLVVSHIWPSAEAHEGGRGGFKATSFAPFVKRNYELRTESFSGGSIADFSSFVLSFVLESTLVLRGCQGFFAFSYPRLPKIEVSELPYIYLSKAGGESSAPRKIFGHCVLLRSVGMLLTNGAAPGRCGPKFETQFGAAPPDLTQV